MVKRRRTKRNVYALNTFRFVRNVKYSANQINGNSFWIICTQCILYSHTHTHIVHVYRKLYKYTSEPSVKPERPIVQPTNQRTNKLANVPNDNTCTTMIMFDAVGALFSTFNRFLYAYAVALWQPEVAMAQDFVKHQVHDTHHTIRYW